MATTLESLAAEPKSDLAMPNVTFEQNLSGIAQHAARLNAVQAVMTSIAMGISNQLQLPIIYWPCQVAGEIVHAEIDLAKLGQLPEEVKKTILYALHAIVSEDFARCLEKLASHSQDAKKQLQDHAKVFGSQRLPSVPPAAAAAS